MRSKIVCVAGFACGLSVLVSCSPPSSGDQAAPEKKNAPLSVILHEQQIWGKDFPLVLAYLRAWSGAKEQRVAVFPQQVVGTTPYIDKEKAQGVVKTLNEALSKERPAWKPEFNKLFGDVLRLKPSQIRVQIIEFFPDDDASHVAWKTPDFSLLQQGVPLDLVHRTLGEPDEIRKKVIPGQRGGRRPTVLTLHSYAKGAVQFAESNLSPKPGTVDRVILEVPTLSAMLFKEPR
jgi:hypothetical protein